MISLAMIEGSAFVVGLDNTVLDCEEEDYSMSK
jgi:hypothetical protein